MFLAGSILATIIMFFAQLAGAVAKPPSLDCARHPGLLHPLFTDNMVFQRGTAVPVWGCSTKGGAVSVTLAGQTASTRADASGFWRLRLKPMSAGGPYTMVVKGREQQVLNNVAVGDVWLCSGQSNMSLPVDKALNADAEIADSANYPDLRFFRVPAFTGSPTPGEVFGRPTFWVVNEPATVPSFSAACYFFGRELYKASRVAQGLILSANGGTRIEWWMSAAALANDPEFAGTVADIAAGGYPLDTFFPTSLFNGMIAPLIPFPVQGFVWYQGEKNVDDPSQYQRLLTNLIQDWRSQWDLALAPFFVVQLPRYGAPQISPVEGSGWVGVREAQMRAALSLPRVGLAVTIDTGSSESIHPPDKQDVADRLAILARGIAYQRDIVAEGPIYESMRREGSTVRISFYNAPNGLIVGRKRPLYPTVAIPQGTLSGFAIAGADRRFVWAKASIDGSTVVVSAPGVRTPVAVRYSWAINPVGNLYNREGLPASPFRTDGW